jgi:hypothetical protein
MEGKKIYLQPKVTVLHTIHDIVELTRGKPTVTDTPNGRVSTRLSMYGMKWDVETMNNINIIGHLLDDPELRHTDGGIVCDLSVVVGDTYSGEDRTDLFEVTVVGERAEAYGQILSKGSYAGVSGHMRTDVYTDRLGTEHYSDKIITDRVIVLPVQQRE